MRTLALGAAMLLLLVPGCGDSGSGDGPDATPTKTVTVTADPDTAPTDAESAEPAEDESDPYAPNLGEQALHVGDTRQGRGIATTVFEVKYPYPPGTYREPEPGNDFIGVRVQQCLSKGVTEEIYTTYNGEFYAVTKDGTEYPGSGSSWRDWPVPKFPESVTMIPGRCAKGWIASEIPKGTKVESLLWRPGGEALAEWLLR